jgi:hypothetical protein
MMIMSEFVIHGHPASPFLPSECLGFEEKGIPYRLVQMDVSEMRGEAHRKLHPDADSRRIADTIQRFPDNVLMMLMIADSWR